MKIVLFYVIVFLVGDFVIEKVKSKINDQNYEMIQEFLSFLKEENIQNEEQLKKFQEQNFMIDGNLLSVPEQIQYCVSSIAGYPDNLDSLSLEEIQEYKKIMKRIKEEESLEEQIHNVILLYFLVQKEIVFPYFFYQMIVSGQWK